MKQGVADMSKRIWAIIVSLAACAAVRAELRTAGELLVDIDAAALSGLNDGDRVSTWPNAGTLGGAFLPVVSGEGPVLGASVGGVRAVTFAGSANSMLTNAVPPPATLCGSDTWSFETWVYNPTLEATEDLFSWTARNKWLTIGSCMEVRHCTTANAIEHYFNNVTWSGSVPAAGAWHYFAGTRDALGVERFFADGKLWTVYTTGALSIRSDAWFTLGGVRDQSSETTPWVYPFSGSLARVRIHSDALSSADVMNNYLAERDGFGLSEAADVVWTGSAGTALPWTDSANWSGGVVPGAADRVVIDNGGTAVVATAVGSLSRFFPVNGGLRLESASSSIIVPSSAGTSVSMGAASNTYFSLALQEGSFLMPGENNHHLYLGVSGGRADVSVGNGAGPALLEVDRDIVVGRYNGGVGRMTVEAGAQVISSNGWICVGVGGRADARLQVNGGSVGFRLPNKDVVISQDRAYGVLEINGGRVEPTRDVVLTLNGTNESYGAVHVNGGVLSARKIYAPSAIGTNLLFLNGGTIQSLDTRADFLQGLDCAYVQAGGAVFDITGGVAVTVGQSLEGDDSSPGGGLVKRGSGTLILSGTNSYSGSTRAEEGTLVLACSSAGAFAEVSSGSTLVLAATNGTGEVRVSGGTATFASGHTIPGCEASRWSLNGSAQWLGASVPSELQLTPNVNNQAGSAYLSERVAVATPWEVSFRYDLVNRPAVPGAGFAFFVQNDDRGVTALGATAGGNGYNGIYRSVGAAVTVFPYWNPKYDFMWASNGAQLAESKLYGLNGVIPANGNMGVRMAYDGVGQITVTLTQGANTFVTNRPVNIRTALNNGDSMLVGVSGGTGSNTADQRIRAFRFSSAPMYRSDVAYAHTLVATAGTRSAVDAVFDASITVSVERLRVASGSTVDLRANPAAASDTAYAFAFREVVLDGGEATVNIASNGTAQGVLKLERLCVNAAGTLVLRGPVSVPSGTLTVAVTGNLPFGDHVIADFTGASGVSPDTVFSLPDEVVGRLVFSGGRLHLIYGQGTSLFLP